jgi:copper ion binding protein
MNKSLKIGTLLAAVIALPLTFRADDTKAACSASGALCPVGAVQASACATSSTAATCPMAAVTACADKAACGECDGKGGECCAEKGECAGTCVEGGECCKDKAVATAGLIKVTYQVDGLACSACDTKLTKVLGSLDGVKAPAVSHKTKTAKLAYDPKKMKEAKLVAAIEKAGYTVKSETIQVSVEGMTCAGCSSKVSTAVAGLKGVKEQKVCHESKTAVVTFDPKAVSRDKVLAAIDQTGFKVVR